MPDQREWHAHLARLEQAKRARTQQERLGVLPQMREATQKAQQVLDHPAWAHFADLLETRMSEVRASRTTYADRMVNGAEMGAALELLKLNVNKCDAELAGLQYALSLLPQMVQIGQQIAGELSQAAAGSVAN